MAKNDADSRKRLVGKIVWVTALIVVLLLLRFPEEIGFDRTPEDRFVVAKVIDGDSVELRGGDRVRLLAIDTPEKGQPLYEEATRLLDSLAVGKLARLEYSKRRRDRYGRLLAYVYLEDSVFVNERIIESGMGNLYLWEDNELGSPVISELLAAQRRAMSRKAGLWALERHPEPFYVASPASLRFHRPSCNSLSKTNPTEIRRFENREEAMYIGLSPCRKCQP